jgi:allophanate hydrolase subunit 2
VVAFRGGGGVEVVTGSRVCSYNTVQGKGGEEGQLFKEGDMEVTHQRREEGDISSQNPQ